MASDMAKSLAPNVRAQFAQRLKNIRAQRGFGRARHFAKSLGIEENRYTRYERAEVEPSLTLIHKICDTLGITPNQLLGFADFAEAAPFSAGIPGLAESSVQEAARQEDSIAWRLASEAVAIGAGSGAAGDPLRALGETTALFENLRSDPFGTVAQIVRDLTSAKDVGAEHKAAIAELITRYTESVAHANGAPR
jgi:transcriptional regulator with XRE-family HTH domain